ncbi:restriction endonuclease subunit S [Staphylococcus epidermidis]
MKLDNLGNIFTGSTPDTSKYELYEGKYPFVSPIDIHNNRYVKSTNKTVSKEGFYGGRVIPKGASLFVCIGSTIGKVGQAEIDVTTNQQINALIPYENYDDNYIYTNLYKSSNKIKKLAATQAVPIINKKTFSNFSIYIPKFKEQKKIGDFFSKLDRQIELEEEKLELLEQQKRGYMQKLFSQELRFKDEIGNEYPEWKNTKLRNVIKLQNGYAFKSNLFTEKGIPIIRITDINKSLVSEGTVYYPRNINIDEKFIINKNDILIAMSGATTGKLGKYISDTSSYLNQRIGKFVMKNKTNNDFLFAYLNSIYFKKELIKLLVSGAQPNISSQDIENIELSLPDPEEQRKIGIFLSNFDEFIQKQSIKIEQLKQRKKGLLQKMFI